MRIKSKFRLGRPSIFIAGACAAAAAVAIGSNDLPIATVLMLAAILLVAPNLPLSHQTSGHVANKS